MDYPNDRDVLETFDCAQTISFRFAIHAHPCSFLTIPQLSVFSHFPNAESNAEFYKDVASD